MRFRLFGKDKLYRLESGKYAPTMREFVNAETNHLGIALSAGKLRFYRRNATFVMNGWRIMRCHFCFDMPHLIFYNPLAW
jgi:hypothetical protein